MSYMIYIPTRVFIGAGALNELGKREMPGKKAMVVISNGNSSKKSGALERTLAQLALAGAETVVFDKVGANPTRNVVMEGAVFCKENDCDFVVALGGGSVMDAAKAMALMAVNEGDVWDYVAAPTSKRAVAPNDSLPVVAITTTAGTGSEVDFGGVISNPDTQEKTGLVHESITPVLAIVDPELMVSVPPEFTAYQGFDALFHATEVYLSNTHNPMSDMVCLTAIENVGKYLARAYRDGSDMEAREGMAFANMLSGYAMMLSATCSKHPLEHSLSAFHPQLAHGAGLIMISREWYKVFAERHACDERLIAMAKALGKADASDPMDFVDELVKLQKACNVDQLKMSDYGITPDEFPRMAHDARATMGSQFDLDPSPLTDEDCVGIYQRSYL